MIGQARTNYRRTMELVSYGNDRAREIIIMAEWIGGLLSGLAWLIGDNFVLIFVWSDLLQPLTWYGWW